MTNNNSEGNTVRGCVEVSYYAIYSVFRTDANTRNVRMEVRLKTIYFYIRYQKVSLKCDVFVLKQDSPG